MMGNPEWAEMELFADRLSRGANWDALKIFLQEWAQRAERRWSSTTPAQARRIPFAPVSTMARPARLRPSEGARLLRRCSITPGVRRDAPCPARPTASRATPWAIRRPAPALGEHNDEVCGEPASG